MNTKYVIAPLIHTALPLTAFAVASFANLNTGMLAGIMTALILRNIAMSTEPEPQIITQAPPQIVGEEHGIPICGDTCPGCEEPCQLVPHDGQHHCENKECKVDLYGKPTEKKKGARQQ